MPDNLDVWAQEAAESILASLHAYQELAITKLELEMDIRGQLKAILQEARQAYGGVEDYSGYTISEWGNYDRYR